MAAEYVALRAMQVKTLHADGTEKHDEAGTAIYREVARGEVIPEAMHWPNLQLWVKAGSIGLRDHFVPDPPTAAGLPAAAAEARRSAPRRSSA